MLLIQNCNAMNLGVLSVEIHVNVDGFTLQMKRPGLSSDLGIVLCAAHAGVNLERDFHNVPQYLQFEQQIGVHIAQSATGTHELKRSKIGGIGFDEGYLFGSCL